MDRRNRNSKILNGKLEKLTKYLKHRENETKQVEISTRFFGLTSRLTVVCNIG